MYSVFADQGLSSECSILGYVVTWLGYLFLILTFPISVFLSVKVSTVL